MVCRLRGTFGSVGVLSLRSSRSSSTSAPSEKALAQGQGFPLGRDPDDDLLSHGIPRTIIGATPFHGPVRDGKAWFQRAMVVRNSVVSRRARAATQHSEEAWVELHALHAGAHAPTAAWGYRIKPHGQLVPVSSRPHSPSTSGLSTGWSIPTLQGGYPPGHLISRRASRLDAFSGYRFRT